MRKKEMMALIRLFLVVLGIILLVNKGILIESSETILLQYILSFIGLFLIIYSLFLYDIIKR